MDPALAKQLYDRDQISKETYDAIVAQSQPAQSSAASLPPAGPPAPPTQASGSLLSGASFDPSKIASQALGGSAPPASSAAVPIKLPSAQEDPSLAVPVNRFSGLVSSKPTVATPPGVATSRAPVSGQSSGPRLGPYDTKLTPDEEAEFKVWKKEYAPKDSGADYDLRGAFKAGITPDPKNGHFPDTFKKPNHPTFSVESQYAVGADRARAGHWKGEKFIPAPKNSTELRGQQLEEHIDRDTGYGDRDKGAEQASTAAYVQGQEDQVNSINARLADVLESQKREQNMRQEAYQRAQAADDDITARRKNLAQQRIDPDRKMKEIGESAPKSIMTVLGLALGAMGSSSSGHNGAVDVLNKQIDRDIDAQKSDLENRRDALNFESNNVARQYARDGDMIGWEATKRLEWWRDLGFQTQALMAKTKSEQSKAQLEKALVSIDKQSDASKMALEDHTYNTMLRKEQAAAAAAAAQAARVEKIRTEVRELTKKWVDEKGMSVEDAQRAAYATVTGVNPGGGALPHVASKEELAKIYAHNPSADKEKHEAQLEVDAAIKELGDAKGNVKDIVKGGALGGAYASVAPAWAPGATDAIKNKNARDNYNVKAQIIVGAAYKLGTNAMEPKNLELIKKYSEPYVINPSDNEEIAQSKIASLQKLVADKGLAKDAHASLPADTKPSAKDEFKGFSGVK